MLLAQRKKRQQLAGKIGHRDEEYEIGQGRSNNIFGPAPTAQQRNRGAAYAPPPWAHERVAPEVNMYPQRNENNINNGYNNIPPGDNAYYNYNAGGGNGVELFRRPMNFPSVLPPLVSPPCPSILPRPASLAARPALVFDDSPAFREAACVSPIPIPISAPQPARVPFSLPYVTPMSAPMPAPLSAPVSGRARSISERHTPHPAHGYVPKDESDPVAERREARRRAIEVQEENARLCEERRRRQEEEKRREREEQHQMELRAQSERVAIGRREQMEMAQEHGEGDPKMRGRGRPTAPGVTSSLPSYISNDNTNNNNNNNNNSSDAQLREDLRRQIEEKKRREADEARRRDEEDRKLEKRIDEWAKCAGPLGSAPAAPNTHVAPSAMTSAVPNYTPGPISSLAFPLDPYPTSLLPMEFPSFVAPLPPPLPDLSFPLPSAPVTTALPELSLPPPPPLLLDTVAPRSAGSPPAAAVASAATAADSDPQPLAGAMTHQLQDMIAEHESLQRMLEGEVRRRPQSLPPLSGASKISVIGVRPAPLSSRAASLGDGEELSAEPSRFVGARRRGTARPATMGGAPVTAG